MKGSKNRITSHLLAVYFLLALLPFMSGCAKKEAEEIKIGAILPLSGDIAEYGTRCKAGIDLALEEINSSRDNQIVVLYEDSQGIPKEGVSAINKLINVDRIQFIIGAVSSSVTLAIEPIATKHKVILFSPASSSPKLSGISPYFFRDWPSDALEATYLAEFVHSEIKLSSIGIMYVNNDYGIGLSNEFIRRFTELGGEVPFSEPYEQGATDFRTEIAKIKSGAVNGIYLAGYHREMALATRQIRELGLDLQIFGDADYGVEELLDIAGLAAEGAIYSMPEYESEASSEAARSFQELFRERYSREPSIFEANGYDAAKIIVESIQMVGISTKKVAEYIGSLKGYSGASGELTFNDDNDVEKPIRIKMVKNRMFIDYNF